MYIPIILGTAREGRQSEKVAKFIFQEVKKYGLDTEVLDVKDYRIAATDNTQKIPAAQKLSEKISKADGLIIVSPEYNHGYPGELKMMLDLIYGQYAKKPLGIVGVSAGPIGGARMVEQLRQVAVELHMWPIREALYFPMVQSQFDENGNIKDAAYFNRVQKFLAELTDYAKILKAGREPK